MEKIGILTTKQVAEILGEKPSNVYWHINFDNLPYVKLGKRYCFFESSILQWKKTYDKQQAEKNDTVNAPKIASILGCSISRVYALVRENGLPCKITEYRDRKRYIFRQSLLIEWLMSQEQNKPDFEEPEQPVETFSKAEASGMAD